MAMRKAAEAPVPLVRIAEVLAELGGGGNPAIRAGKRTGGAVGRGEGAVR